VVSYSSWLRLELLVVLVVVAAVSGKLSQALDLD
jgi:hypothetical protein